MSMNKEMVEVNRRQYKAYALAKPINATPSRTHVNSAMAGPYKPSTAQLARPEGNDAANIQSKGF